MCPDYSLTPFFDPFLGSGPRSNGPQQAKRKMTRPGSHAAPDWIGTTRRASWRVPVASAPWRARLRLAGKPCERQGVGRAPLFWRSIGAVSHRRLFRFKERDRVEIGNSPAAFHRVDGGTRGDLFGEQLCGAASSGFPASPERGWCRDINSPFGRSRLVGPIHQNI